MSQKTYQGYAHTKLKTDEPDEENMNGADETELRELRSDLEDSRTEIQTLTDEVRRLR